MPTEKNEFDFDIDATGEMVGADLTLAPGIVLELATIDERWGVWGIRIDGHLYREPRDLGAEPLIEGPFRTRIESEAESAVDAWDKANRG